MPKEDSSVKKALLALTAMSLLAGSGPALAKGPCKDKHGKFVKCPKVCRNAKGHYATCK
jgi:hypothetical protein